MENYERIQKKVVACKVGKINNYSTVINNCDFICFEYFSNEQFFNNSDNVVPKTVLNGGQI